MKTAKDWFEESDRCFVDAVQRVMTVETSANPFGVSRTIDWKPFSKEMAHLHKCAQERHAAKHAAAREAALAPLPTTLYRDATSPSSGDEPVHEEKENGR